jgi:hypothetical protein
MTAAKPALRGHPESVRNQYISAAYLHVVMYCQTATWCSGAAHTCITGLMRNWVSVVVA